MLAAANRGAVLELRDPADDRGVRALALRRGNATAPTDGGPRQPSPARAPPPTAGDVATWRTLWKLRRFAAPHRLVVAFGIVCLAGIAAMDLLKPWPLKVVLDDILQPGAAHTLGLLAVVAGYAALPDGTVMGSSDGGAAWRVGPRP